MTSKRWWMRITAEDSGLARLQPNGTEPATPLEFAIQPRFSRLERIQARNSSRGRVFNTASGVAHPRRALAAP